MLARAVAMGALHYAGSAASSDVLDSSVPSSGWPKARSATAGYCSYSAAASAGESINVDDHQCLLKRNLVGRGRYQ